MINRQDMLTIFTLSLVFFLMATWNLGFSDVPITTFQVSDNEFYIDLGASQKINAIYILIKRGDIDLTVYTGHPEKWSDERPIFDKSSGYYYAWKEISIASETQFIKFVFKRSSAEIAEIAVLGEENKRILINTIKSDQSEEAALMRLIDEQEKIELPPTYMSETYFDEIYYVRTAENYLKFEEPYEWTHPPLGKLIMAFGILIFGYNPFGWRIMGVIFATLMIPLIYFLAKKMFGTWIGAFVSAFLLMFDFMHFTMARIATVDTFVVFFSLTSQFFFLSYFQNVLRNGWKTSTRSLFLAVFFFSVGFSTKWYVFYGFLGQIFLLIALRFKDLLKLEDGFTTRIKKLFSHPFLVLFGFVAIAVIIYFLTFVPYLLIGNTFMDFYSRQWGMYIYHSTLEATHPFSSPWWSWPVILRPVWLYVENLPGMVSTIAAMGNPAVWWFGFGAMILAVERAARGKDYISSFIILIFFLQWIPYALISRIVFLYHFYVNVPLLCLATAYFFNKSWSLKHGKIVGLAYLLGVLIVFMLFYPVISGHPIPYWWRENLKLFESWVF